MKGRFPVSPLAGRSILDAGESGFTLVEVIVSMTILALIMLATVTGLRTLGDTREAIDRMTGRADEIRAVSSFLRDTIESAVISGNSGELGLGGGAAESTFFVVHADSLEWKSTILFGENYGGSYFLRLAMESGQLVLRWQEITGNGSPGLWANKPSKLLVDNVEEFSVAFRQMFASPWLSAQKSNDLPELVRLRLRASGRYWPDLIMRVQH